ncbi:MAG TPA: ADOP family duplicated permease [Vicinamibacterales bacterium]|nr:ADOP family duplicated permease [Vicinamibacterales bacterium]
MEPWLRDIRLAWRRLRLAPGFTCFAIASLAVGIGVSSAIYAAVRTLFWMPMGIPAPERTLSWTAAGRSTPSISWPDFLDIRAQQSSFSSIGAARRMVAAISIGSTVETVFGESVSGEYFATLGLAARHGRLLQAQDEADAARVAVVSESFWRSRLGADPAAVGRLFTLGGETFELVGVVRGTFHGVHLMLPASIWIPEVSVPDKAGTGWAARQRRDRNLRSIAVWGRLKPGVTAAQASAEAAVIGQRLDAAYPPSPGSTPYGAVPRRVWTVRDGTQAAEADRIDVLGGAILFAVAMVLLIACTNLANLSLAKGTSRMHEIAVRTALGASRGRLVREHLLESGLVTLAGGALGLVLLVVLTRAFETDLPIAQNVVIHFTPEISGPVLLASAVATMLALFVFGVWPALQSTRDDVRGRLGAGGAATPARWRLHRTLVAWQVSGSVAMVLVAAMCVKVVSWAGSLDAGIDYRRLALAQVDFALNGRDPARARAIVDDILASVRAQPGVERAAASSGLPFGMMPPSVYITPIEEPFTATRDVGHYTYRIAATPDVLATLGMRLVRGRGFTDRDDAQAPRVAIVSEGVAREVFNTIDVVGRTVMLHPWRRILNDRIAPAVHTIVGVSADTDTFRLTRRGNPPLFVPLAQHYDPGIAISVRSANPSAAVGALRAAIRRVDPELALMAIGTGPRLLEGPFLLLRIVGGLAAALGGVALLLAMAGLYGVLAHVVARRTREIGIRIAIGANRGAIFRLILRDGFRPVLKGLVIGLVFGVLIRVALKATIVTTLSPIDPGLFVMVPVPFALAALLACCVPASRAARVEPNVALRDL